MSKVASNLVRKSLNPMLQSSVQIGLVDTQPKISNVTFTRRASQAEVACKTPKTALDFQFNKGVYVDRTSNLPIYGRPSLMK